MKELGLTEYAERYFDAAAALNGPFFLTETGAEDARLPHRKPVSHKYSYGRALLIAGSRGFSGAPVLAANACERSGAGLTQLMVPESVYAIAAVRCDGAVVKPLTGNADGCAAAEALPELLPALEKADACVVGPGLGTGPDAEAIVRALLRAAACPLVLDADALTVCAGHAELFKECRAPLILTPHAAAGKRVSTPPAARPWPRVGSGTCCAGSFAPCWRRGWSPCGRRAARSICTDWPAISPRRRSENTPSRPRI